MRTALTTLVVVVLMPFATADTIAVPKDTKTIQGAIDIAQGDDINSHNSAGHGCHHAGHQGE